MANLRFNFEQFLQEVERIRKRYQHQNYKFAKGLLSGAGEVLAEYGYQEALAFVTGKFEDDKGYTDSENADVLVTRDLILYLEKQGYPENFASYLVRRLRNILELKAEEGKHDAGDSGQAD